MNSCRALTLATFVLALAVPAGAQEGNWEISGEVRYVAHYEGQTFRSTIPFSLEVALDATGSYEIVAPPCVPGGPPVVTAGTWTRGSKRFVRAVVRDSIRANITACAGTGARVHDLHVRQRLAPDEQSATGKFTADVRYRFVSGDELETVRARIVGHYEATRIGGD